MTHDKVSSGDSTTSITVARARLVAARATLDADIASERVAVLRHRDGYYVRVA